MPEPSAIVKEALARFKLVTEADQPQRDREVADLKFQDPKAQWDEDAALHRGPVVIDGVSIAARPMLSIPKLDQPIQLVLNQERAAHLGVTVTPLDEDADDDTAEVIQGLYRRIEQDSRAHLARSWAFDRAVKCGRGAYRVNTRYCDDRAHPFDQEIRIERLLYQSSAYFDPFAQEPDWSDGEWAFVMSWLPWDRYVSTYGKTDLAKGGSSELDALANEAPTWATTDSSTEDDVHRAVLVAEYWRVERKTRAQVQLDDESVAYEDEIPKGRTIQYDTDGKTPKRRRTIESRTVRCYVLNGREVIDSYDWNGRYIPLIPVIGRELQPVDSARTFVGMIGPGKDAQKLFNYAASQAVESAALEPRAPFDIDPQEIEGYEAFWKQANIRNLPYLPRHKVVNGQPMGPLQRIQADTSKLQLSMMLLNEADKFVQTSTATFEPSLGSLPQKDRSGRAIMALQQQSDAGNSHFLHNLASVSMTYEAKVVLDLLPSIYDRPGRVARILDFEDTASAVILNQPFTRGPDGRPQPAQSAPGLSPRGDVKTYDLRKGSYGVNVTIGKSWQTRLQQGEAEIGAVLQANPALMPLIGPTYFKFRDFPGSPEIAEILKKMRAQQYPFLEQEENQQPDAQQLQAQLQALQQQLQAMQAQLQQAGQIIQTKQVEVQGKAQTEQAKIQAEVQLKQIEAKLKLDLEDARNRTQIAVAEINAMAKGVAIDREAFHAAIARDHTAHQEQLQAAADRSHEWDMAEEARAQLPALPPVQGGPPGNGQTE
jgi:hypothetical protein